MFIGVAFTFRRLRRAGPLLGCVALAGVGATAARAANLYAYANGGGMPSGCPRASSAVTGCSLATALAGAHAGDSVMLASPGAAAGGRNYVGNWAVATAGTSARSPVTIDGTDVKDATLDGNRGASAGCSTGMCSQSVLWITTNAFVAVKGLTIQHAVNGISGNGGAIRNNRGGTLTITESKFSDDRAKGDGGGAIANGDGGSGTVTITQSIFTGNTASLGNGGGAIANGDGGSGTVTISDSTFTGNHASDPGVPEDGGAIDNGDGGSGTVTITNSTFSGNRSTNDGGAIDNGDTTGEGTVTITGSTFTGNRASKMGGAVGNEDFGAVTVITNSTLSGDGASGNPLSGNAEIDASDGGTVVVSGSTLAAKPGNSAISLGFDGGSVFVAGDLFAGGCEIGGGSRWIDRGYNAGVKASCFKGGPRDAKAGSMAALGLGVLAANGGPTETRGLQFGSPAVGIVPNATTVDLNNTQATLCPGADQRGRRRPGSGGRRCDAGAFETQPASAPKLSGLTLSPRSFAASTKGPTVGGGPGARTTIRYADTLAGVTTFQVLRCKGGRGSCRKAVGSFTHRARRGYNRFRFSGRVASRALVPGHYVLAASGSRDGSSGKPVKASFVVLG